MVFANSFDYVFKPNNASFLCTFIALYVVGIGLGDGTCELVSVYIRLSRVHVILFFGVSIIAVLVYDIHIHFMMGP